jgi:hypothetical protein
MAFVFGKVYAQNRVGVPQLSEATNWLGETTNPLGEACKIKTSLAYRPKIIVVTFQPEPH